MPVSSIVLPSVNVCKFCGCDDDTKIYQEQGEWVCYDCIVKCVACMSCPSWGLESEFAWTPEGFSCKACSIEWDCPSCQNHTFESMQVVVDGVSYCRACVPVHGDCKICNTKTKNTVGRYYVCPEHALTIKVCQFCQRITQTVYTGTFENGTVWHGCEHCLCVNALCNVCDTEQPFTGDFSARLGKTSTHSCIACAETYNPRQVGSYSHQHHLAPLMFLPSFSAKTLYYGVELEQEVERQPKYSCGYVWDVMGDFIIDVKHDGSLQEGHETVTKPMTYAVLKTAPWAEFYRNPFVYQDKWPQKSVGMHVHMSLSAFSTTHLYKFCEILYRCSMAVETIGGRGSNEYSLRPDSDRWSKHKAKYHLNISNKLSEDTIYYKHRKVNKFVYTRYDRVNLTEQTAELRFFSSPLNVTEFNQRIQLCESLYQYTKTAPLSVCCGEGYWQYIVVNQKLYPDLYNFCYRKVSTVIASFNAYKAPMKKENI